MDVKTMQKEIEPTGWVVMFYRVDGPTPLGGTEREPQTFPTRDAADAHALAIYEGRVEEYKYLKDSTRIHVWTLEAWYRHRAGVSGRVFLPTDPVDDGIRASDMNQDVYE
jgi:hypothetical protein